MHDSSSKHRKLNNRATVFYMNIKRNKKYKTGFRFKMATLFLEYRWTYTNKITECKKSNDLRIIIHGTSQYYWGKIEKWYNM